MALSQADFNIKLDALKTAVDALKAAPPQTVDLTAEGAKVDAILAEVQALTPAAPAT